MEFLLALLAVAAIGILIFRNRRQATEDHSVLRQSFKRGVVRADGFDEYGENVELGVVDKGAARLLLADRLAAAASGIEDDDSRSRTGFMLYRSDDDYLGFYANPDESVQIDPAPALLPSFPYRLRRVNRMEAEALVDGYVASSAEAISQLARFAHQ